MKWLTDVAFWNDGWWNRKRPERLWLYRDLDFEMVQLLGQGGARGERVLEIGGGGSRILPYLGKKFGFRVAGSDFSLRGCELLKANLALKKIAGDVVREDLFRSALAEDSFDLVFSHGVIEHFDDITPSIAEHIRVAKPGGKVVVVAPNLEGVQGRIFAKLAPALWEAHTVFSPRQLADKLEELGLQNVHTGYLGSVGIYIGFDPRWSAFRKWPRLLWLLVHLTVRIGNGLVSLACRLSPWKPHTRALSPAFFAAGTKPKGCRS